MRNKCNINTDGINVNIFSEIHIDTTGKIFLLITNLIVWPGLFYIFSFIPVSLIKNFIPVIIILPTILIFTLGGYTIWNLWGKEFVRVNVKSISYRRSYGIFETKEKVIKIDRLGFRYEKIRYFNNIEHGKIHFFNYNENNIPEDVFETSILIPKEKADEVDARITELFITEYYEEKEFAPFSMN